jgi:hypothetical protein
LFKQYAKISHNDKNLMKSINTHHKNIQELASNLSVKDFVETLRNVRLQKNGYIAEYIILVTNNYYVYRASNFRGMYLCILLLNVRYFC